VHTSAPHLLASNRRGIVIALPGRRMTISRPLRVAAAGVVLAAGIGVAGCARLGGPMAPDSIATDASTIAASTAFCVDEVNRLRATAGLPALSRSSAIDEFSTDAAKVDGEAHEAHTYFRMTNGGNGTARAENMIPWWKASQYGSVRTIIRQGLQTMWQEGPGGSHYENMKGGYSEIGCGVYVSPVGEVTVSQDFR
jgi:uncharacterized protein YkwD